MVHNDLQSTDYSRHQRTDRPVDYSQPNTETERLAGGRQYTGTGMVFFIGAIVLAILALFWLFSMGDTTAVSPPPDATITIEEPAPATVPGDTAEPSGAAVSPTIEADVTGPADAGAPAAANPQPADN